MARRRTSGRPGRRTRTPVPAASVVTASVLLVLGPVLAGCTASGGDGPGATSGRHSPAAADPRSPGGSSSGGTSGGAGTSAAVADDPQDPARYAADVVRYAREAGVDPRLVLAVLYNESYKPHDAQFEDSWAKLDPDAARGIANMHRAAFDDTKRGRPFAARPWEDLTRDPGLAVRAQAWFLHDLRRQLPSKRSGGLTVDELLALGYNAGAGNMRAFARGTAPGPQAADYLRQFRRNWTVAGDVLAHGTG